MNWLSQYLKFIPGRDREGLTLERENILWEITPTQMLATWLRHLPALVPAQSIIYLEGHPNEPALAFLNANQITPVSKIAVQTVWPRPVWHHLPVTPEILEPLAKLVELHGGAKVTTHIHVYRGQDMLVTWHDAMDLPAYISRFIPEGRVLDFCTKVGIQFRRIKEKEHL